MNTAAGKCSLNLACNNDSSCTDCGQGTNYVLVVAKCLKCKFISKCLQCSQASPETCSICASGYFINGSKCSACPSACSACLSENICTRCASGYTLPAAATQSSCLACTSPCRTCSGTTTYCTSCVDGFTKKNWMCENNVNVGFRLTLGTDDPALVLRNIDLLIISLLKAMGLNT